MQARRSRPITRLLRCLYWPAGAVAILNERFAVAVLFVVRRLGVKLRQLAAAVVAHNALVIQQP
jgi:hypothetical protein